MIAIIYGQLLYAMSLSMLGMIRFLLDESVKNA